jgi:hypothetical protein
MNKDEVNRINKKRAWFTGGAADEVAPFIHQ